MRIQADVELAVWAAQVCRRVSMSRELPLQRPRHADAARPDGDADRLGFNCRTSRAGNSCFCFYLMLLDVSFIAQRDSAWASRRRSETGAAAKTRAAG
jgi:hypothetical protein